MMKKLIIKSLIFIKESFQHPIIQIALALGLGAVVQSHFYKNIYHIEVNKFFILLPGMFIAAYEFLRAKKKYKNYFKTIYLIIIILLIYAISIIVPYYNMWYWEKKSYCSRHFNLIYFTAIIYGVSLVISISIISHLEKI